MSEKRFTLKSRAARKMRRPYHEKYDKYAASIYSNGELLESFGAPHHDVAIEMVNNRLFELAKEAHEVDCEISCRAYTRMTCGDFWATIWDGTGYYGIPAGLLDVAAAEPILYGEVS